MALPTAFHIRNCSFDMGGSVSIGAMEITVDVEGDGHTFEVTHVWADGLRADDWLVVAMKHWVSADLARTDGKSSVRQAYRDKLAERTPDDDADDHADFSRDQRRMQERAA